MAEYISSRSARKAIANLWGGPTDDAVERVGEHFAKWRTKNSGATEFIVKLMRANRRSLQSPDDRAAFVTGLFTYREARRIEDKARKAAPLPANAFDIYQSAWMKTLEHTTPDLLQKIGSMAVIELSAVEMRDMLYQQSRAWVGPGSRGWMDRFDLLMSNSPYDGQSFDMRRQVDMAAIRADVEVLRQFTNSQVTLFDEMRMASDIHEIFPASEGQLGLGAASLYLIDLTTRKQSSE